VRAAIAGLLVPLLLGAGLAACATPPKPRELEAYDNLRRSSNLQEAGKKSPDLVAGAEKLSEKSHEEWQSNDLEDSRRDALMAQVKLKTALTLAEQDQLKAKIQAMSQDQAQAEEQYADVAKDLASEQEKLTLLQKYVTEKQRLSKEMTSAQQKAEAEQQRLSQELVSQQKIAAAQLSLRTAETVEASKYAKTEFSAASDMLAKADADLKQNDYAGAQASAEMAKKNADRAVEIAKPLYEQAEEANQNKARDDALARDASAITGVSVKLERRGELQRLVVVVPELFEKYPTYPVQVIGYTDNRGKASELLAVSAARAQVVYSALAARGVEARRLNPSGLGGEEPYVDNKTSSGRAKNNRVEIVFLYH